MLQLPREAEPASSARQGASVAPGGSFHTEQDRRKSSLNHLVVLRIYISMWQCHSQVCPHMVRDNSVKQWKSGLNQQHGVGASELSFIVSSGHLWISNN